MKTSSFSRLAQAMAAVVAVTACVLAVSCEKAHRYSGGVNQEAVQQIAIYETYDLAWIERPLDALSDEAAKHSAQSDTVTLVDLLNKHSSGRVLMNITAPVVGYVLPADTAAVDSIITQYGSRILPLDLKLAWSKSYSHIVPECYELVALRTSNRLPAITGEYIEKATSEYDKMMGYVVTLEFTDEGSRIFSRVTDANIGKSIAFVVKGKVYCYPRVNAHVDGGRVQITGDFTEEEANGLVDFIYGK